MARKCVNINSKEFKKLVKDTGYNPVDLEYNIGEWQDSNNTDEFPSREVIDEIMNNKLVIKDIKVGDTLLVNDIIRITNIDSIDDKFEFIYLENNKLKQEYLSYSWALNHWDLSGRYATEKEISKIDNYIKKEAAIHHQAEINTKKGIEQFLGSDNKRSFTGNYGYSAVLKSKLIFGKHSMKDALDILAKEGRPEYSEIAKNLLMAIKKYNIDISLKEFSDENYMEEAAAIYVHDDNEIILKKGFDFNTSVDRIVLHEAMHAVAFHMKEYTNDKFNKESLELYKYVKEVVPDSIREYGLTDVDEFIAEAFTNKNFQELLASIEYTKNTRKKVSVLQTLYEKIINLIGITDNSVLKHIFIAYQSQLKLPKGTRFDQISNNIPFYKSTPSQRVAPSTITEASQDKVIDYLNSVDANISKTDEGYFDKTSNEEISKRVSDTVADARRKMKVNNYSGNEDALLKGATIHMYLANISSDIIAGKKPDINTIREVVSKMASTNKDFQDRAKAKNVTVKQYTNVFEPQFKELVKGAQSIVDDIKKTQEDIDPEGSVEIRSEQIVLSKDKSTAGSIDLVSVFSDGSIGIYDFTTSKEFTDEAGNIKPLSSIRRDLETAKLAAGYKSIIEDNTGNTTFRMLRVVPINVKYGKKGFGSFDKVEMANVISPESYLTHIPIEGEKTTYKKLDAFVDKIHHEKSVIRDSNKYDKKEKSKKLNALDSTLQILLVKKDVSAFANTIYDLANEVKNRLVVSDKEDSLYIKDKELLSYMGHINIYNDVINFKDELSKLSKSQQDEWGKKLDTATNILSNVKNEIDNKIVDRLTALSKSYGIDIDVAVRDPGVIASLIKGKGDIDNPIFQMYTKATRRATNQTQVDLDALRDKLDTTTKNLTKYAKSKGKSLKDMFDLMLNHKKNLVSEFSKYDEKGNHLFTKDKNGAIKKKNVKWFQKYTTFDEEYYNTQRDKIFNDYDNLTSGIMGDFERDYGETDGEFSERRLSEASRRKNEWVKTYNPKIEASAYFNKSNPYIRANKDESKYKSDVWLEIQDTKELREFYNLYVDFNKEAQDIVGRDAINNKGFVANYAQTTIEGLFTGGLGGLKTIGNAMADSIITKEIDEMRGYVGSDNIPQMKIPVYGTADLFVEPTQKELDIISQDIIADGIESGSREFNEEYEKRRVKLGYDKGTDIKSIDLAKNLLIFAEQVYSYKHKDFIEDQVHMAHYFLKEGKQKVDTETKDGLPFVKFLTNKVASALGVSQNSLSLFETFVKRDMYGQNIQSKGGKVRVGDKEVDLYKLYNKYSGFMTLKALSLDPVLQTVNHVGGKLSLGFHGKEEIWFNNKSVKESLKRLTGRNKKDIAITEYFKPWATDFNRERAYKLSMSKAVKGFTMERMMIGYKLSEENIDKGLLLGMTEQFIVDSDGKIKNPKTDPIINSKAPSLHDSMEIVDDKMVINGVENINEEYDKFRAKVQKISNLTKGTMTDEQRAKWEAYILGRMLMKFRSWMPGTLEGRYGKLKYDNTLEAFTEGRMRATLGNVFGHKGIDILKQSGALIAEIALMGGYKQKVNQMALKNKYDRFRNENPKSGFTFEQFSEWYVPMLEAKLRAAALELRVFMGFALAVTMLGNAMGWDDDEENGIFTLMAYRVMKRTLLELSFFYDKGSADEFISRPIPFWNETTKLLRIFSNGIDETIDISIGEGTGFYGRFTDEKPPVDKSGFFHYLMKEVPVGNKMLGTFDYWDNY